MRIGLGISLRSGAVGEAVPSIALSGSTIPENASVEDDVGTFSVANPSGTYTFTLTDDAGGLFVLNADGVTLEVAGALDYETAQSHTITVTASNGVDADLSRTFTVFVMDVVEATLTAPTLTWTSAETVDPPEFNIDLTDPQVDDKVRRYRDGVLFDEYTLTADDLASLTFPFGTGPWGNGTFDVYVTHVRGAVESAASNTEVVTINVVASWTPSDLGAKLWAYYDPKDATSVFSDDGTTQVTDGGTVYRVNDLSGNGRHLRQSSASQRPTYSATGFAAGKPSIVFDTPASIKHLATTADAFGTTAAATFATIATLDNATGASYRLAAFTGGSDTTDYGSDASGQAFMRSGSANGVQGGRAGSAQASGSVSLNTRFRAISMWDGIDHEMTVDGSAASASDVTTTHNFGTPLLLVVGAGREAGSAQYPWVGTMGPLVVCNDSLTVDEQASLDAWLAAW